MLSTSEHFIFDIGSCQTRVSCGSKIVFNEPTCIALHTSSQQIIAIGIKAYHLLGREPESVEVVFPVKYGVIAVPEAYTKFLEEVCNRISPRLQWQKSLFPDKVDIIMPRVITPANKYILSKVLSEISSISFKIVDMGQSLLHYYQELGYRPPIMWLIDIGGDVTYAGAFYDQKVIAAKQIRWGALPFGEFIQDFMLQKHGCQLSWQQAETLKHSLSENSENNLKKKKLGDIAVIGKDTMSQHLTTVQVKRKDLEDLLQSYYTPLVEELKLFLADLPVETTTAMLEEGISLSGGGSQLSGLDVYLAEALQTSSRLAKLPSLAVIKGRKVAKI